MTFPVIDAHQHIWDPARVTYDWLGPDLSPIDRAMTFDDVEPELRSAGVQFSILVQSADSDADTAYMRAAADRHPTIAGIVGFVPLDDPASAAAILDDWEADPLMVGVRNLTHHNADPEWLLRPDVGDSLRILEERRLPLDIVAVLPRHLDAVSTLSERHPRLRMVVDHLGHPPIGSSLTRPWFEGIGRVAENPLVFAKVSGLYSVSTDMSAWTTESVRPFFEHACDVFSVQRLMFGGDWPISVLAGGYKRVWNGLSPLFDGLHASEREDVLGRTAAQFYRLHGLDRSSVA